MSDEIVPVKVQDFLEQDPELRGQKFVCLSFISPEDVILKKELYFFENFISGFSKEMSTFLNQMKEKYPDDKDVGDTISAVKGRYDYLFDTDALKEEYKLFTQINSEKLETEYLEKNKFQTSMRGIKVRGCYETMKEAQNRAENLRKNDPAFDIFVSQVGCWCPWSPNPDDIADFEYGETQINTLMKKYKENQANKDQHFNDRKDQMIEQVKMHRLPREGDGEIESTSTSTSIHTTTTATTATDALDADDTWLLRKSAKPSSSSTP